jgi:hypothetical protein
VSRCKRRCTAAAMGLGMRAEVARAIVEEWNDARLLRDALDCNKSPMFKILVAGLVALLALAACTNTTTGMKQHYVPIRYNEGGPGII